MREELVPVPDSISILLPPGIKEKYIILYGSLCQLYCHIEELMKAQEIPCLAAGGLLNASGEQEDVIILPRALTGRFLTGGQGAVPFAPCTQVL